MRCACLHSYRRITTLYRQGCLLAFLLVVPANIESSKAQAELGDLLQYFPQVAIGGGYTTAFTVHNPSSGIITVRIEVFSTQGDPLFTRALQLLSFATQTVKLGGIAGTPTVGWARLTADGRFSAAALFQLATATNQLVTQVGVLPSPAVGQFRVFATVQPQSGVGTGIAIANVSATSFSALTVRRFSAAGRLLEIRTLSLRPLQQIARLLSEEPFFPRLDDFDGTLDFSASGPVVAVTLRLDSSQLASVPVITLPQCP